MDNLAKSQIQKSLFDFEHQDEDFSQTSLPTSKTFVSICEPLATEADRCDGVPEITQNGSRAMGTPVERETLSDQHARNTEPRSDEQTSQAKSSSKNGGEKTRNTQEQATEINLNKIPGKFVVVSLADLQALTPAAQSLQKAFGQLSYVAKTLRPLTTHALAIFLSSFGVHIHTMT